MNAILKTKRMLHTLKRPGAYDQRRFFSSEFKKYFGFEEKLEQRKFRNDENMEFSIKKMDKVGMVFTACCKKNAA